MKIKSRKYARKEARKLKKQKKSDFFSKSKEKSESHQNENYEELENEDLIENEDFIEEENPENQEEIIEDSEEVPKDRPQKPDKFEREIMKLEERLGLRGKSSKTREKNWKKIKKQLELDGLGSDFYDILEGKTHDPIDEVSISPASSPDIRLAEDLEDDPDEEFELDSEQDINSEQDQDQEEEQEMVSEKSEEISLPVKRLKQENLNPDGYKKVKGLLNRLSDQNIEPLTKQISELFKFCSNSNLFSSIWEFFTSIFATEQIPTQLLAVYSCEIAALSRLVGREISAFLLEKLYGEKEKFNLSQVSFVAYLYYFGVIGVEIIKGFINSYILDLNEAKVEFLITTFNIIGFTLRKKQPGLLKDLISSAQSKFKSTENPSTRFRVLLENLLDIKNNKKKQNLVEDRLKFLKTWLKTSVIKSTGIKEAEISTKFEEISSGKWRDLLKPSFSLSSKKQFSSEIESLARAQKMNTESRKTIFCLIMTAEDYMDAFAKLVNLKKQERDIVRVVIICAGQEGTYNKFYSLLSSQLCSHQGSYKYSFQYALWDNLKEFSEFSIRKISNIAKLFADLIAGQSLELGILKAVNFDDMDEHLSIFLRILLENVLVSSPVQTIGMIFERLARNDKLSSFAEGLRMFIKITIIKSPREGVVREIGVQNFLNRAKIAKKALKTVN